MLYIGKETNLLEQQEEGGLIADPKAIYLSVDEYDAVRELLGRVSIPKLPAASGVSERMLQAIRSRERDSTENFDPQAFERDIAPRLHSVALARMMRATGLSRPYCSRIRRGDSIPHARHWSALEGLIE